MDKKEKAFDQASDIRKFEIGLFWQRSLFFWGFIATAFIAYAEIAKETSPDKDLLVAIAGFGLVCSVAWTLANRGSKYWQENWEIKLRSLEEEVLGEKLFSKSQHMTKWSFWGSAHYSVSRLTIALSDFVVGLWVFLAIKSLPGINYSHFWNGKILIPLVVVTYVVLMLFRCRSKK